jgi:hypothetical protein
MKTDIYILIVEDSHWFSEILVAELKRYVCESWINERFRFVFHTFYDGTEVLSRMKSHGFKDKYFVAFLDYYLGNDINASHIMKLIREQSSDTSIVLFSQSMHVRDKVNKKMYDFFVYKDESAPAFCRLCLEQNLENRFFVPLS